MAAHGLLRKQINRHALRVIDQLFEAGYEAFLVGGGVRDLLLGQVPKDFDVVTNATPEEVRSLFKHSRVIGRRFQLVHVVYGREVIEVATYRRAVRQTLLKTKLRGGHLIPRDNAFGTQVQDAMRRDFNVNALYYDVRDGSIIDYSDSYTDLQKRQFRMIGDPERRYREDPVRLLRAVRLMAKSHLQPTPATEAPIQALVPLLASVSPARLFDEVNKAFMYGYAEQNFDCMVRYGMLGYLFPTLPAALSHERMRRLLKKALQNTDQRFHEDKSLNPAFLLSVFLWPAFQKHVKLLCGDGVKPYVAKQTAASEVLQAQVKVLTIPKRLQRMIKEIWSFQPMLEQGRARQVRFVIHQKRFRAAYDFLCLHAEVDARLQAQATWWTDFQAAKGDARDAMLDALQESPNNNQRNKKQKDA